MRVLVVLVHYFSPQIDPKHSSVDETKRQARTNALEEVITKYRGLFGRSGKLRFTDSTLQPIESEVQIDIRVITVEGCSLLTPEFQKKYGVRQSFCDPKNPKFLGFYAHRVMEESKDDYDWFVYSEDDLRINDPQFFDKLVWFNETFGDAKVLSPNRYEWNTQAIVPKTYIDGDISQQTFERLSHNLSDQPVLTAKLLARDVKFHRARNPHSGFFAISQVQLKNWMSQPFWRDLDVSFVSPLESAATLGLSKAFQIYKSETPMHFLEIEHQDSRFSSIARGI